MTFLISFDPSLANWNTLLSDFFLHLIENKDYRAKQNISIGGTVVNAQQCTLLVRTCIKKNIHFF